MYYVYNYMHINIRVLIPKCIMYYTVFDIASAVKSDPNTGSVGMPLLIQHDYYSAQHAGKLCRKTHFHNYYGKVDLKKFVCTYQYFPN